MRCFLQWADPFGASNNDYDLLVVNPATASIITSSTNRQSGFQNPQEMVVFSNPLASPVVVGLAIPLFAGSARALKLLCPDFPLQYSSVQFGILGHAARPEVIAVAAIDAHDRAPVFLHIARHGCRLLPAARQGRRLLRREDTPPGSPAPRYTTFGHTCETADLGSW